MKERKQMEKEIQSINLRSRTDILKVRGPAKPFLNNRDMCLWMCTICASLIVYLLYQNEVIILFNELVRDAFTVVISIALMTSGLFALTQAIVKFCYRKAKKKSHRQSR